MVAVAANEKMDLTPKSCLVVRNDTDDAELEKFQRQTANLQRKIEHIFILGVDFSESPRKLPLLETIFRTRTAKWRAITLDRCQGPIDVLISAFLSTSGVTVENLTFNSLCLSVPVARSLREGLQQKGRGIQKISFCGCRWTAQSVALCLQGLKKNDSINTVRFNGGVFCDRYAPMALADAIGLCHTIRRLEFFSCCLSDVCAARLVSSLHQMPNLEYLDLGRNACASSTLEALGKLLGSTTSLHTLNLSLQECPTIYPSESSFDLSLLTLGLKNNSTLRSLFLRGSRLDDQAVDTLIEALVLQNSCLERLILTDCVISNSRIHSILEQLGDMTKLRALWLDGVQDIKISSRHLLHQEALKSLQSKNTSLTVLKFPFGSIDSTSAIQHLLDLNWGGRRLVFDSKAGPHNTTIAFPYSCWPLVLERVNILPFDSSPGLSSKRRCQQPGRLQRDYDEGQERRANVLYYFLRHKILIQS